jgi:hypothetical protein
MEIEKIDQRIRIQIHIGALTTIVLSSPLAKSGMIVLPQARASRHDAAKALEVHIANREQTLIDDDLAEAASVAVRRDLKVAT